MICLETVLETVVVQMVVVVAEWNPLGEEEGAEDGQIEDDIHKPRATDPFALCIHRSLPQ